MQVLPRCLDLSRQRPPAQVRPDADQDVAVQAVQIAGPPGFPDHGPVQLAPVDLVVQILLSGLSPDQYTQMGRVTMLWPSRPGRPAQQREPRSRFL
jgi:hypothetical protein